MSTDASLADLRPIIDRARHAIRNRALGLYAAALVVMAIVAALTGASFYEQGPMVLVGILALAGAGFHLWYWRIAWERHPVLRALVNAPSEIAIAMVLPAEGRAALLDERQVEIATRNASILLTVQRSDLGPLASALAARCPSSTLKAFPS